MAASDFVTETQLDSLTTTIANAVKSNTTAIGTKTDDTAVNNHISDATDAHDASAISVADVGTIFTATDVEAALAEVKAIADANAADTTASDHISDATAAHAASAISFADVAGDYTATDVEAALAEVRVVADAAAGGGVAINDLVTNTSDAWSSSKITSEIGTAVSNLVASAPAALDTLDELAAALGDDANFATTTATALGNRLRFDAAQSLDGTEKNQAWSNLQIAASTVDFASNFTTAIA